VSSLSTSLKASMTRKPRSSASTVSERLLDTGRSPREDYTKVFRLAKNATPNRR
jgi:hypothetical protein